MNFRTTKYVLLLGAINGIVFYLAYQPVKVAFVKYLWHIKNDDYVYVVLPQIYRIASDVGEIIIWTALFTLASYNLGFATNQIAIILMNDQRLQDSQNLKTTKLPLSLLSKIVIFPAYGTKADGIGLSFDVPN